MSHNYKFYGTISQSFYEPILPDFQRSPLYPIFLSWFPVYVVLFLQHAFILFSGFCIQKLSLYLNLSKRWLHYLGVLFCLTPYSINLSSLIMSESLFTLFLTLIGLNLILFYHQPKWQYLVLISGFVILAAYTRASILPFIIWLTIFIAWASHSLIKSMVFVLIIGLGLLPWIYRNYTYTEQWFFTSMSEISILYGRIGGTSLAFSKNFHHDAHLKVEADHYLNKFYALENLKSYYNDYPNEETEKIKAPLTWVYLQQHFHQPFHAFFFHVRTTVQQFAGLSYRMTLYLYQNSLIAIGAAIFQAFSIVTIYLIFVYLGLSANNKKLWYFWLTSIVLWLLIHNAAWADGRYRYINDLWAIIGIILLESCKSQNK